MIRSNAPVLGQSALAVVAAVVTAFSLSAQAVTQFREVDPVKSTFPATGVPQFSDVTAQTGVNFVHRDSIDTMAGGVCFIDYDNDGDADFYATSRGGQTNRMYENLGNGTFQEVTTVVKAGTAAGSMGAYAADFDNDGDQDMLIIMVSRIKVLENNGNGLFLDKTNASRITNSGWTASATFGDYDNDGFVDIYLGNYIEEGFFPYYNGGKNRLFKNNGDFTFTDVTDASGVAGFKRFWDPRGFFRSTHACTLSTLFYDYDRDGWLDLLVGNDFGPFVIHDLLYRNNQDGTFTEVSQSVGFAIPEFNMGLAAGDANGDLLPDIYTTNMGPNHLLLNDGQGRFQDVTTQWGASEGFGPSGLPLTSWACLFFDLDLDGLRDLYVSNGWIAVTSPPMPNELLASSKPLQNLGRSYQTVPEPNFPWDRRIGRGAACADFDGDGDEDLAQLNNRDQLRFYRNDTVTNNNQVTLDFEGQISNRDGIGAYIVARHRQFVQAFDHLRGGSYGSCNGASLIIGLGTDPRVEQLTIKWPSGLTSRTLALAGNQRHKITEPTVTIDSIGAPKPAGVHFIEIPVTLTNHATTTESVNFSAGLSMDSTRISGPAYHAPINVAPGATTTESVYLAIPYSAIPVGQQLGAWFQLFATSGALGGQDHVERPF